MTEQDEDQLVDVPAAAVYFRRPPATIRGWIMRYGIESQGRHGGRGRRKLYSLSDLLDAEARASGEHRQ